MQTIITTKYQLTFTKPANSLFNEKLAKIDEPPVMANTTNDTNVTGRSIQCKKCITMHTNGRNSR
ncbi:hypothetical protein CAXC1_50004 [Candidatus Xenohaliotis californiensis]|uniref:Uncharacterized protein n=1 Tax=Candidatus Xenohaliotis californiensis TaxID=84677 RepID=A0ABM9N924_9RICK|nr:hypothetical protein CAXC1_50004 [Candidatus Xenohaliotis californiensis]